VKSNLAILFVVFSMVLGLCGFLHAESTPTQVTNNTYVDSFPHITGNYLVWQGYVGGDWEIFLYDIALGVTTQITDNSYNDTSPKTNGTHIVWKGFCDGESDIFLWDGSEIRAISEPNSEDSSPQIAGRFIVFTSNPFGDGFFGPGEIILYDITNGTSVTISQAVDPGNMLDDSSPHINNRHVMWIQEDSEGNTTSYVYSLPFGPVHEAAEGYVWKDNTRAVGETEVLTRYDGGTREIFVYHNESDRYVQITDDDVNNTYPSISGNYIAWKAGEGPASEICLAFYADADTGGDTPPEYEYIAGDTTPGDIADGADIGDNGLSGDRGGSGSCLIDTALNSVGW
jgi:beta propeller repeat protein